MPQAGSPPGTNRAICVYCGSASGNNPAFVAAAQTLGAAMAANRIDLVYGGGGVGLMGEVAKAVIAGGGTVIGIIPEFLKAREVHLKAVQELIVTKDMHERKMRMFERSDAFVALPGGIGTLEELIEQLTWVQLGQHKKPIIIANVENFWQPLLTLLEHMRGAAFLSSSFEAEGAEARYRVIDRIEAVVPEILGRLKGLPEERLVDDIAQRF